MADHVYSWQSQAGPCRSRQSTVFAAIAASTVPRGDYRILDWTGAGSNVRDRDRPRNPTNMSTHVSRICHERVRGCLTFCDVSMESGDLGDGSWPAGTRLIMSGSAWWAGTLANSSQRANCKKTPVLAPMNRCRATQIKNATFQIVCTCLQLPRHEPSFARFTRAHLPDVCICMHR